MKASGVGGAIALFACIALTTVSASAQMSEGEKKAAARAAYSEGVVLQDKGNPAEALARFEAAEKLFDAPTHLLHIAECQALTGKLVEASETYESLIRKPLGKDAPDAFVQAQEQGKAELTQLRRRIPSMRITIKPDPQTLQNLQITVNDRQLPADIAGIARPVNPGPYKLSATATGYGTAAPVDVEVKEQEPKSVELVLQQGQGGAVAGAPTVVVGPATGTTPAPYEQPKPKPAGGPSSTGLLLGVRPGVFIPAGSVTKDRSFKNFAAAGPGVGIDLIGRVARLFLVGGALEFASLGPPDTSSLPAGTKADISTLSIYAGVLAGILPNVDRVSFIADVDLGMRFLSQSKTLTVGTASAKAPDETYSGIEVGLNAGVSIPAGPIRIVPKAGVAFGEFSNGCVSPTAASSLTTTASSCTSGNVTTAGHTMLNVALGLYYNLDFSKK